MKYLTHRLCSSLIILTISLFCCLQLSASHVVGSDITYKCTSTPGIFEVTLVLYRNCDGGIELCSGGCGATCTQTMSIRGADPSCASSNFGSFTLSLVSLRDANIDPDCANSKNTCRNMNCLTPGTYTPGVERYEFKGFANIGPTSGIPASCCNVRFSWETCCRNGQINTIASPAGANFYVDAVVNRCFSVSPCNSSPELSNDPFVVMCASESQVFNNGAIDPDMDSLSFTFAPSLVAFNTQVTYLPPWSSLTPMPWAGSPTSPFPGGIRCDPVSGDISFTPGNTSGSNFTGIVTVEIKQWKTINGVPTIIGITRRDNQMVVLANCAPNNPPRIVTNPPNVANPTASPKTNWEVCAGEQLCFTVTARDTDFIPSTTISDTTYLSWNRSLLALGATFTPTYTPANRRKPAPLGGPREDNWQFCWTPDAGRASNIPYYFTVSAKDNRCPNPGRKTYAFSVKVLPQPAATVSKTNRQCNKWRIGYVNQIPSQPFTSTQLQIAQQPYDYTFAGGFLNYTNVATTPDILFAKPGKYLIKLSVQNALCSRVLYDTLQVDTLLSMVLKDTLTCSGSPVTINGTAANGKSPYEYRWYNSIRDTALTPLNSPNFNSSSVSVAPIESKYYTLELRDSFGCKVYDSVRVNTVTYLKNIITTPVKCYGESNGSINLELIDTNRSYQYKLNSGSFQTSKTFTGLSAGLYTITVKDSNNCNSVTSNIAITQPPLLRDTLSSITSQTCYGVNNGSITFQALGGKSPYLYSIDSVLFINTGSFSNLQPKTYKVFIKDANNCLISVTKTVLATDSLYATLQIKNQRCFASADGEIWIKAIGGKKPYTYKLGNGLYQADSIYKNLSANAYSVTIRDANQCVVATTDSVRKPAVLESTIQSTNVSCFGGNNGTIQISSKGGNPPYRFSSDAINFDTLSRRTNLTSKTYIITTKDSTGCTTQNTQTISQPLALTHNVVAKNLTCNNSSDGKITVTVSGGTSPYTFQLDSVSKPSNVFDSLKTGPHTIVITDKNGCTKTISQYILEPLPITGVVTKTPSTCFDRADGSLTITPSNGKLPYSFNLDSGAYQPLNNFSGLKAKDYVIGIKDSSNCRTYINSTIVSPPKIIAGSITGLSTVALNSTHTYSIPSQTNLNYQWMVSKGRIMSGVNTPSVTIQWDSIGTEHLRAWVYQDSTCGDTALMQVAIGGVGLDDVAQLMGLTVFPNPTQSLLNITLSRLPAEQYLYVYDLQGKVKVQQEIQYNQQLDLQDLPSGMYFLVVGDWKGKVVKQ